MTYEHNKMNKINHVYSGFTSLSIKFINLIKELDYVHLICCKTNDISVNVNTYIQLDGVEFFVIGINGNLLLLKGSRYSVEISTINNIKIGTLMSLGLLATNDDKIYALQSDIVDTVQVIGISVLEYHTHTLKIDFKIKDQHNKYITEFKYIGLNGSSLTVRDVTHYENIILFSIYVGKQTRENTIFNNTTKIGSFVNFTLPFVSI